MGERPACEVRLERDAAVAIRNGTAPHADIYAPMVPASSIDDEAGIARNYMRHARAPSNVTGRPALGPPIGFSPEGLPLGIEIAGRACSTKRCSIVSTKPTNRPAAGTITTPTTWSSRHDRLSDPLRLLGHSRTSYL